MWHTWTTEMYTGFWLESLRNKLLGRPWFRPEGNIKMDLTKKEM